jgi:hypothetical protein
MAHKLLRIGAGSIALVAGVVVGRNFGPQQREIQSARVDAAFTGNLGATSRGGGPARPIASGQAEPIARDAARSMTLPLAPMDAIESKHGGTSLRQGEPRLQQGEEAEARRWYACRFDAQQIEWALSHAPNPCTLADASLANSDECRRETFLIESRIKELQFEQRSLRCDVPFAAAPAQ